MTTALRPAPIVLLILALAAGGCSSAPSPATSGSSGGSTTGSGTSGGSGSSGASGTSFADLWDPTQLGDTRSEASAIGLTQTISIQQNASGCDLRDGLDPISLFFSVSNLDGGGVGPGRYDVDAGAVRGDFLAGAAYWDIIGGYVQIDAFDLDGGSGVKQSGGTVNWYYVRGSYDLVFGENDGGIAGERSMAFESRDCH